VTRGDIVTVALQGDRGKPRPALIVQADQFRESSHVALLLLTSFVSDAPLIRIPVDAAAATGLAGRSFAMLDRIAPATPPWSRSTAPWPFSSASPDCPTWRAPFP